MFGMGHPLMVLESEMFLAIRSNYYSCFYICRPQAAINVSLLYRCRALCLLPPLWLIQKVPIYKHTFIIELNTNKNNSLSSDQPPLNIVLICFTLLSDRCRHNKSLFFHLYGTVHFCFVCLFAFLKGNYTLKY